MTGNTMQHQGARRRWLKWLGGMALAGVMVLGTAAPTDALANPNRPVRYAPSDGPSAKANQGKANLTVQVVRADKSGKVDPSLRGLERQLSFTGYTGFRSLSSESLKLGKGQSDTVSGGAGYKLKADLVGHDGKKAKVRLRILKGSESRVDTTTQLHKGKAFTVKGQNVKGGAVIYVITYK